MISLTFRNDIEIDFGNERILGFQSIYESENGVQVQYNSTP